MATPATSAEVVPLHSEPTWAAVVGRFLLEYDNPTTIATYGTLLSELAACNGWQHPHQMDPAGIVRFVTQPRADGRPRANNSVRARIATVRTFHDYCRRNDIPAPDCETVLRRLRKSHPALFGKQQGNYPPNRLDRQQLQRLYDACKDGTWNGSRDQLLIRLLALGLRRAAAASLTWNDVQPDGHIAKLGKYNRIHHVFPGPTMTDMLTKWRRYYETNIGPAHPGAPVLCVFQAAKGQKVGTATTPRAGISSSSIADIVQRRATLAGLGHVAPHDLRRSLARIMNDEGEPITNIQAALGHSLASLAVTQACYIGPLDNKGRIAGGALVD